MSSISRALNLDKPTQNNPLRPVKNRLHYNPSAQSIIRFFGTLALLTQPANASHLKNIKLNSLTSGCTSHPIRDVHHCLHSIRSIEQCGITHPLLSHPENPIYLIDTTEDNRPIHCLNTLWELAPEHHDKNANILECLNADLNSARACASNEKGLLNYAKSIGLEMIRQRLNWLVAAATLSPNTLWCIHKTVRWSRFFRSMPASNKHVTLPNPCHIEDLTKKDTHCTYTQLQPIMGNWLQGYPSDTDIPLEVNAHNAKISELFTRLAMNDCQPTTTDTHGDQKRFSLEVDGQRFTSLNALTDYLTKAGYHIEIYTASRVADFFGLHHQQAGASTNTPPRPVPLPMFFQTKWKAFDDTHADAKQHNTAKAAKAVKVKAVKASLPIMHSETVIRITPPNPNRADKTKTTFNTIRTTTPFESELTWLMSVGGIGFKAGGEETLHAWSYPEEHPLVNGEEAWELVNVMGLLTRALTDIGRAYTLPNDAYFAEGACNDYAALLQAYVNQPIHAFPLTLSKDFLTQYLTHAINHSGETKTPALSEADTLRAKRLLEVLEHFPNDIKTPKDQLKRALEALPWKRGEPSPWPAVDRERLKLDSLQSP